MQYTKITASISRKNYPEEWRKRLEAGEVVSYEEDGEQCEIWLEEE